MPRENFEETPDQGREKEQTPEEIRNVLETALKNKSPVDLMIKGEPEKTLDLLVSYFDGDCVYMTYLVEEGEYGELIPLEMSRIIEAKSRES
jgi:hypothetical protein